jgi:multidrug efflux pump subunit AcrB
MVTANIDKSVITIDKVNNRLTNIFTKIERAIPGVSLETGGQFEEFSNTFANIGQLFILSLIIIFLILGTQFNSYSQPLIILTTVPFALIGAMLGLLISGNPFSIVSMFGFVALAGIVVNDAIVMIDFINKRRSKENISSNHYWKSIIDSSQVRLRPIILTSLTTISGLTPMAFGLGGQSGMWAPLANVILFGLLISTMLTLFVIPCFVAILDDIKRSRKKAAIQNN